MQKMAQQVQQMQADMARAQAELEAMTIDGTAGGGAVTATVNGHGQIVSVAISKDVVDPDDLEMLQDLVTAAVSDAQTRAQQTAQEKMGRITGGMNIPGLL
jgi:DNA-binding YbaB/EbfC family protein